MGQSLRGLIDCHTHSEYSFDAEEKLPELVNRAISLGLTALCITDHCEMNDPDLADLERRMRASVRETAGLSTQFSGSIRLLTGLELGQGLQNLSATERFLTEIPVDFLIGSLHNLAGEEDFYYLHYTEKSAAMYLERYFDELYEMAAWGGFDCLGHLTYPLRYMIGREQVAVDMERFAEPIDRILQVLAEKELALEINTSGLRGPFGRTMPDLSVVRRFRELGGKHIVLGSDAHTAADVGKGISEGAQLAREAGFTALTYYVKHQPVLLPIE